MSGGACVTSGLDRVCGSGEILGSSGEAMWVARAQAKKEGPEAASLLPSLTDLRWGKERQSPLAASLIFTETQ